MSISKVYFTSMHTHLNEGLPTKLQRLIRAAGIERINFKDCYAAIKLHFGEPGNLAFLRPNYAAAVAQVVRELGGKPFLTDCNTLYVGGRKNALDHLESAYKNGFTPYTTGCHIIIADGLKGTDEAYIPVSGGEYIKEAKIGHAVADADIIISLNHFKGHEVAGMGGALKNIGMGCGSRAGKMEMHSAGTPYIEQKLCIGCGRCHNICAHDAAVIKNKKATIDTDKCVGCGRCIGVCPTDAAQSRFDEAFDVMNKKVAEYAKAVIDGKPHFHISLVIDVSPNCDCHAENDVPIVPDIGMFASFDPVALDTACADAVNRQPVMRGSVIDNSPDDAHSDRLTTASPGTNWRACTDHAEKIGIGSTKYELVEIK